MKNKVKQVMEKRKEKLFWQKKRKIKSQSIQKKITKKMVVSSGIKIRDFFKILIYRMKFCSIIFRLLNPKERS